MAPAGRVQVWATADFSPHALSSHEFASATLTAGVVWLVAGELEPPMAEAVASAMPPLLR